MLLEQMECALVRHFNERQTIIIPNFYIAHECDLLVVRKTGYAVEVEIKRSVADTKKDNTKKHGHKSNKIAELYFAFPEDICQQCLPFVPTHAGVFLIRNDRRKLPLVIRTPERNKNAEKLTEEEIFKILRYGLYRVWNLKKRIVKLKLKK